MGNRDRKNELFDQFARVGKALASGKRLELLDLLAQGERDVASLAAAADLGVTTASAHLQTLRQVNLVATRRDGTRVLYRLAGADVADLFARVRTVAQAHLPDVEAARIAYLGGAYGVLAHDAVRLLQAHGHTAGRLDEGMLEWRLAGLPVATTRLT